MSRDWNPNPECKALLSHSPWVCDLSVGNPPCSRVQISLWTLKPTWSVNSPLDCALCSFPAVGGSQRSLCGCLLVKEATSLFQGPKRVLCPHTHRCPLDGTLSSLLDWSQRLQLGPGVDQFIGNPVPSSAPGILRTAARLRLLEMPAGGGESVFFTRETIGVGLSTPLSCWRVFWTQGVAS